MRKIRCFLLACAAVFLLMPASPAFAQGPFKSGCPWPFTGPGHPIDQTCGLAGVKSHGVATGQSAASALQNKQKNNFCAGGTPETVTVASLIQLQTKADQAHVSHGFSGGKENLPASRDALKQLGEGKLVRFAGFMRDPHASNVGAGRGESVNCYKPDEDSNDVHIALFDDAVIVPTANPGNEETLCTSATAEVSPHHRPLNWKALPLEGIVVHPVRITGALFFDASHDPCTPGHPQTPYRATLWEIHPIYNIEVCVNGSLAACKVDDNSVWQSIAATVTKKKKNQAHGHAPPH